MDIFATPPWLPPLPTGPVTAEAALEFTIDIALASAVNGGGPFGSLLLDFQNKIVATGWNAVIASHDSTAHAEIVCLRRFQQAHKCHALDQLKGSYHLYCSASPCIQCFGALYWSGVKSVTTAAGLQIALGYGFDEGPVSPELWQIASNRKGLTYHLQSVSRERQKAPFEAYFSHGGQKY